MNLIELTDPPSSAYPVAALADHLRLGTGFADDAAQNPVLEAYLRAATAAIEARIGRVVLTKRFAWEIVQWRTPTAQGLPIAPVRALEAVVLVDRDGGEVATELSQFTLRPDSQRPSLVARGRLPAIPADGAVRIVFSAGYSDIWAGVPKDLQQAVLGLAAHYYERRSDGSGLSRVMPFGVLALLQRFQPVRLSGRQL